MKQPISRFDVHLTDTSLIVSNFNSWYSDEFHRDLSVFGLTMKDYDDFNVITYNKLLFGVLHGCQLARDLLTDWMVDGAVKNPDLYSVMISIVDFTQLPECITRNISRKAPDTWRFKIFVDINAEDQPVDHYADEYFLHSPFEFPEDCDYYAYLKAVVWSYSIRYNMD